ncbi:hypothetical protein PRZ48_013981 [Zasmidium cellare]|uniref:Methyltransferase type 11 domain-containing protein n=1 Tax=Zasmidium cellare TaxID=395010 RepID=A0ABR0DZN1_ZASCE|nr:hypothetical protein PRZ48_013981 [Zasmidium cellare]
MELDVLRPDFFVTDCHKWLNVPRGCAVLHVLPEHHHIFRTTIPPSFGYIPKTGPVSLPLWGQQVAGSDDSTTRPSAFQTLFKLVPTSDDTPYLCISAALEFREKVCGGEDGIYSYLYNLAISGSDRMAEILGTEVLSEPGLQPGEVSEMRQCGIATVMLPLAIVGEGGNDHNKWEGAAMLYPPLGEAEGPSVVQYLSKALADEHDTWLPMLELNGWIWVRVCAQVFLEVSDFEWVARVLKKLCDQVGRREALPRLEPEVRQTQENKASSMSSTRLFDKDGAFWANYLSGRPQPPDAFYERIFSYHASHGGDFGTAHDVGARAGVHTAQIAKRFQHVLVSDIEEQNVQAAQRRHGSLPGEPVFHTAKLEDASWIEQESVDLVFAASCINWCDLEMAIEAVDWQLKAGGTLAIAGMGFAALENARAQDVWYRLFQRGVERNYIQKEEKGSVALSALACDASAYDAVPIPERVFDAGALRYRLNFLPGWSWYLAQVPGEREDVVPRRSQIGANDVVKDQEQDGWSFQADMAALRRMAGSFPIWGDGTGFEDLWSELEDIVGAGTVEGVWPAVLILARKRDADDA